MLRLIDCTSSASVTCQWIRMIHFGFLMADWVQIVNYVQVWVDCNWSMNHRWGFNWSGAAQSRFESIKFGLMLGESNPIQVRISSIQSILKLNPILAKFHPIQCDPSKVKFRFIWVKFDPIIWNSSRNESNVILVGSNPIQCNPSEVKPILIWVRFNPIDWHPSWNESNVILVGSNPMEVQIKAMY